MGRPSENQPVMHKCKLLRLPDCQTPLRSSKILVAARRSRRTHARAVETDIGVALVIACIQGIYSLRIGNWQVVTSAALLVWSMCPCCRRRRYLVQNMCQWDLWPLRAQKPPPLSAVTSKNSQSYVGSGLRERHSIRQQHRSDRQVVGLLPESHKRFLRRASDAGAGLQVYTTQVLHCQRRLLQPANYLNSLCFAMRREVGR